MYRVGVDIGGTKVSIGIFDDNGHAIAKEKAYITDISDICEHIKCTVLRLADEKKIPVKEIKSCGVGIPGTVSDDGRRIVKAPNIVLLQDFAEELEKILDIPVGLVQDSIAAAWGEYLYGGGRGRKNVVCIALGTGIGMGIVLDGRIYSGPLGCAGEIGHIPAVNGGRICGCGKRGCLEKYCAGGGLDITASEILGDGKKAVDLFEAVHNGNREAVSAVKNAVEMLGNALIATVNLMSPDCILLSGGLSAQTELYIEPLIRYVQEHCYNAGKLPVIKTAELNENAPLYGAAYLPIRKRKKPILSASIMCADILNMGKAMREIERAGIGYLHCDIMDNHFVPNLMLPTEMLNKLRYGTVLPFDFHIMAENPESIIEKLDIKQGDIVSVHYESTVHLQRVVTLIKEKGAKAAVAINPATPVEILKEILPELDMILIMSVNPGFAGQKIVKGSFDKITRARKILEECGLPDILIEVDGNCSFENVPKMHRAGADIFVVGTSSVFTKDLTIEESTNKLYGLLLGEVI